MGLCCGTPPADRTRRRRRRVASGWEPAHAAWLPTGSCRTVTWTLAIALPDSTSRTLSRPVVHVSLQRVAAAVDSAPRRSEDLKPFDHDETVSLATPEGRGRFGQQLREDQRTTSGPNLMPCSPSDTGPTVSPRHRLAGAGALSLDATTNGGAWRLPGRSTAPFGARPTRGGLPWVSGDCEPKPALSLRSLRGSLSSLAALSPVPPPPGTALRHRYRPLRAPGTHRENNGGKRQERKVVQMTKPQIVVYSKPNCVQCNATYRALDAKASTTESWT